MDRIQNPFSPGAGTPPPELAGRETILEQAGILLKRVKAGRPEKSMLLTGLRGVGKTVLLNELERMALDDGYRTTLVEAHEGKSLALLLAPHLRRLLFDLDRIACAGDRVRRGLAVLRSFVGAIKISVGDVDIGLDIEPEHGTADSGDLEVDLPEVFAALGEAARERKTSIALLIDEIQYANTTELSALIMAMHKVQQRQLPVVMIGAGLPILPGLAGESKSYAERLFNFPEVGPLPEHDAFRALQEPVRAAGVAFTPDALREIFRMTQGYPYFLQEWGYQAWNQATATPIGLQVVLEANARVAERLDANFFRVRFDRLTPAEKLFLRAMSELGSGPYRTSDVAEKLGVQIGKIGPRRAGLIKKGMIYSPSYGDIAFTVPLFDQFMRRAMTVFPSP